MSIPTDTFAARRGVRLPAINTARTRPRQSAREFVGPMMPTIGRRLIGRDASSRRGLRKLPPQMRPSNLSTWIADSVPEHLPIRNGSALRVSAVSAAW